MRLKILIRKLHKWLGLLLGLQLLLWVTGGVVMSLLPIDKVRGTYWLPADNAVIDVTAYRFPVSELSVAPVRDITLAKRLEQPVYIVTTDEGRRVFDANTGQPLPPISATEAAEYAKAQHRLHPSVVRTVLVTKPAGEVRGQRGPLWQVTLDDPWNMRVYIDASTGQIVARRNDLWRLYDFFWMLHIMDYGAREDFNNNLLRSSAVLGWIFAVTGVWLLFYSFRRSDFMIRRQKPYR